jgi:hypothetical protein
MAGIGNPNARLVIGEFEGRFFGSLPRFFRWRWVAGGTVRDGAVCCHFAWLVPRGLLVTDQYFDKISKKHTYFYLQKANGFKKLKVITETR